MGHAMMINITRWLLLTACDITCCILEIGTLTFFVATRSARYRPPIDCRHRALQLQNAIVTIAEIVSQIPFVAFAKPPCQMWPNTFSRDSVTFLVYGITTCTEVDFVIHRWLTAVPRDHLIINGASCFSRADNAAWIVNSRGDKFVHAVDFNLENEMFWRIWYK